MGKPTGFRPACREFKACICCCTGYLGYPQYKLPSNSYYGQLIILMFLYKLCTRLQYSYYRYAVNYPCCCIGIAIGLGCCIGMGCCIGTLFASLIPRPCTNKGLVHTVLACANYPARACASKGLCDRSWCLYVCIFVYYI